MYSSDLYQKALNRLDRRREEDELRTAATLAEVSAKVPRLEEIQNQLRQVGFSISKAFFAKDAKADKIAEACHRYAQRVSLREPANLMLMGQTGLGKTHLSLAIANVAIGRGLSVEYGTAYNILSDLQNENFGRTGNLQYTEERVLHTDLLILDDLGTEYTSAYTVACLYNIINTRILCSRPTVISTNLGFDELAQKYDQRITSRIAGAYSRLVLVGNDIRYIK